MEIQRTKLYRMGMLRLFLPNNKVQFNVESQKDSVRTPVNMKSPSKYFSKFFRPREFLAEFLGWWGELGDIVAAEC